MARNAMGPSTLQLFRGGLNDLNLWAKHLGGACCDGPTVVVDRLNPTINPENANVHTAPFGNRDNWRFGDHDDSRRDAIIRHINAHGVGAQLEVLVIPTFSLLYTVQVVVMAEEAGLTFSLATRNGTALPAGQLIQVAETDSAVSCGEVSRVQTEGSFAGFGQLGGASRVHVLGVSGIGGEFALEADALILQVDSMPVGGVKGYFDVLVHIDYIAPGRSEAMR
jgi:hypothetical protein